MAGPSVLIRFDIEAIAPKVLLNCANDVEEIRLLDWIRSQDALAEIVQAAIDLAAEARAA